jgi:hypothetical protein
MTRELDDSTWNTYSEPIREELDRARNKFPDFHSMHEGYATLLEEVDELWQWVKEKQDHPGRKGLARAECRQIAAMAIRFAMDCCDRRCEDE